MARLKKSKLLAFVAMVELGCSLGSFDYLSADFAAQAQAGAGAGGTAGSSGSGATAGTVSEGGAAGSGQLEDSCQGQGEGSPCDDGDVCTRTSLCVAGVCQGAGDHPCVVADSVREFSMTQGLEGFWYGAWKASTDPDGKYDPESEFQELLACPDLTWRPACVAQGDPAFRWTLILAELQHAATLPGLELPIRRWVSDVSGLASAALDHHHADPGEGDGTRAQLLVDGQPVWENEISSTDALGRQEQIPVELEVGTRLELVLHPRANESRDMSHFSLIVTGK